MAAPFTAPMPPDLELFGGYTLRLTALDPGDGSTVAGVTVADLVIAVALTGDTTPGQLDIGPYMLVPGSGA